MLFPLTDLWMIFGIAYITFADLTQHPAQIERNEYEVFQYGNFKEFLNHTLNVSDVLAFFHVQEYICCAINCIANVACVSFNFAILSDINTKLHTCHLLATDKYNHSGRFVPNQRFHHYTVVSPCESFPCQHGGTCRPLYETNNYACTCPDGTSGKHCELGPIPVNITSGGYDDPAESVIRVDGTDHSLKKRGHNVVAINQMGRVIEAASFDTFGDCKAGKNMKDWINGLTNHTVVLISVKDSGEKFVDDAADALRSLGAKEPLKPTHRASWLLVGYKGTGERPSWIRQAWKPKAKGPSSVSVVVLV